MKYKLIFLTFFMLLLIFCLSNNVYADITFTYDNKEYTFPTQKYQNQYFTCDYNIIIYHNTTAGGLDTFDYYGCNSPMYLSYRYNNQDVATAVVMSYSGDEPMYMTWFTGKADGTTINNTVISRGYNTNPPTLTNYSNTAVTDNLPSQIAYSDQNIYIYDRYGNIVEDIYELPVIYENYPYFLNTPSDIALGEQDLIILPADFSNTDDINFVIQVKNETSDGQGGVIESWTNLFTPIVLNSDSPYYIPIDNSGVGFYYKIPWSFLINYLEIGKQYDYILSYNVNSQTLTTEVQVTYGGLTPEDAIKNSIANQSNLIREQMIIQQQTNEKIDELNNTITDDTITSTSADLPTVNVNDPSENGINNIFQSIYNAFCTGQAQDIIFPIPFTDKNITLSPYYVRDMLNNNNAVWVYTLIQAFWGYLIGRYIVKDISHKITKIKSGDIENIENNNIKEEML